MQDLNKIRDDAIQYVIKDIENRTTGPLTSDEKKQVQTLIEDAMLAPVRTPGLIDDLADYVEELLPPRNLQEAKELLP